MSDIRVADTATLVGINERSQRAGLKQTLPYAAPRRLDSFGYHVLSIVTTLHRDVGESLPLHRRVRAVLKVHGGQGVEVQTLDVLLDDWQHLPSADLILRSNTVFQELNR